MAGYGLVAAGQVPGRNSQHHRVLTGLITGEAFEPASPEAEQAYWITHLGGDPQALLHVLHTQVATTDAELSRILTPVLVAAGDHDFGHASAEQLATTLPYGRFIRVPGDHFTALASPELVTDHHLPRTTILNQTARDCPTSGVTGVDGSVGA